MNKAIVIVDTPINCNDCKFCIVDYSFWGDIRESKCLITEKNNIVAVGKETIDKNCPLKPLPEKRYTVEENKEFNVDEEEALELIAKTFLDSGWNACIDEILGDENE